VVAIFVASALYAHLRGRQRFGLLRALTDFTVLLAPVNALMYLFSRVPPRPYLETQRFRELELLQQHWQTIRDEALRLQDGGYIRAASGYNDIGFFKPDAATKKILEEAVGEAYKIMQRGFVEPGRALSAWWPGSQWMNFNPEIMKNFWNGVGF
jgi:hypothetical protein